jgi:N-acyl-D-amino-acid deacylase
MSKISFILLFSLVVSSFNFAFAQTPEVFDLLITNARIIDGAGNPWFRGSIAVKDGKIVRVGRIENATAKQTIDAQNKIVAPGFIDVHGHVEGIYRNPKAENFVRMGVTSIVTGNCGGSTTDVKGFLARMNETPLAVNLGTLIAHGSVRSKVMGLDNRAPTPKNRRK